MSILVDVEDEIDDGAPGAPRGAATIRFLGHRWLPLILKYLGGQAPNWPLGPIGVADGGRFAPSGRMNRTFSMVLIAAAVLVLSGCQTLADLNIQNPSYRLTSIRPRVDIAIPFSASRIDFDLGIDVENPNGVGLRLDRMDFDLLVNGAHVVSGLTNQRIRIPAEGTGRLDLTASVGYGEISTLFREVVGWIQGDRPSYEIRGKAYYDTPIGQMSFPVTVYRAGL
jgi:LEA14-like dessication related protein